MRHWTDILRDHSLKYDIKEKIYDGITTSFLIIYNEGKEVGRKECLNNIGEIASQLLSELGYN